MSEWRIVIEVDDPDDLSAVDVLNSVEDAINKDTYMKARRITLEPLEEKAYVRRAA